MEVHRIGGFTVYLGFGFSQPPKNSFAVGLYKFGQVAFVQYLFNVRQGAMGVFLVGNGDVHLFSMNMMALNVPGR